jgi:hypothetical protein
MKEKNASNKTVLKKTVKPKQHINVYIIKNHKYIPRKMKKRQMISADAIESLKYDVHKRQKVHDSDKQLMLDAIEDVEQNPLQKHEGFKSYLTVKNPHVRDNSIKFEEEDHLYSVDWTNNGIFDYDDIVSVSGLYKKYFPEFDADKIITKMMNNKKTWPKSKYYGMTPHEIKTKWSVDGRIAAEAGSAHHQICEDFYNGIVPLEPYNKPVKQLLEFAKDHEHLTPFRTEWVLRSDIEHRICGTPDILFISPNHKPDNKEKTLILSMFDWKNSKEIKKKNYWEKGTTPFNDLDNVNYFHYAIQLNVYKYLIEQFYAPMEVQGIVYDKIVIDNMYLIVMHENRETYMKSLLPNYQSRIQIIFDNRKQYLLDQHYLQHNEE